MSSSRRASRRTSRRWVVATALLWLATRLALVLTVERHTYPQQSSVTTDVSFYRDWAQLIRHGHFPTGDNRWQYPAGAALPMLVPLLAVKYYRALFASEMLLIDLAVYIGLVTRGLRRPRNIAGVWVWVAGLAALGPVSWFRFDLAPTAVTMAALCTDGVAAGALIAVGAWLKLWPAVALPALRRRGSALLGAVVVAALGVGILAAAGRLHGAFSFVHQQRARGLQVESPLATPVWIGRLLGGHTKPRYEDGAFQFTGGHIGALITLSTVLQIAVVIGYLVGCIVLHRRHGRVPVVATTLAGVLALMLATRVLSPQYLVWVIGLVAIAVTVRGNRQAPTAVLLIVAALLSQWLYPSHYQDLLHAHTFAVVVLVVRNVLLLAALGTAVRGVTWEAAGHGASQPAVFSSR